MEIIEGRSKFKSVKEWELVKPVENKICPYCGRRWKKRNYLLWDDVRVCQPCGKKFKNQAQIFGTCFE